MSSGAEHIERAKELVRAFTNVLTPESRYYITQLPKSEALTPEQLAELRQISNHFLSGVDNAETATNSDDTQMGDAPTPGPTEQREVIDISDDNVKRVAPSQTNPTTKKRGRPRVSDTPHKINAASKPWGTILAKETFQLDDVFQRHLKENVDFDPTRFISNIPFTLSNKPNYKEFLKFATGISEMPKTNVEGRVRCLFLLIRLGEIAREHIGADWANEKTKTLELKTSNELGEDGFKQLRKVLRLSDRLLFICECRDLGIGSILYLQEELYSHNILYYRISKTGDAFNNVIQLIRDCRLKASIQESQADKSADAILGQLRKKYKVDSLGAVVEDPEDGSGLRGE